jgi:hypothetical protein
MSLLLGALRRLETRPSANFGASATLDPSAADPQRAPSDAQTENVNAHLDSIAELAGMISSEMMVAGSLPTAFASVPTAAHSDAATRESPAAKELGDGPNRHDRAVRQLAADILASFPKDDRTGLAFVAPEDFVGTAELSCRLAIAIAQRTNDEVLLVPHLGGLGRSKYALLTSETLFRMQPGEDGVPWYESIIPALVEGLSIINAIRPDTAEVPWQTWKRRFRFCIVESDCDSGQFLAGADGVYLTIALQKTQRHAIKNCISRLRSAGIVIRGSVLLEP